jgi:hypothetical protein
MIAKRLIAIAALALAVAGPATTAGAAGTVTITGSSRTGDLLTVTGGSTYTAQPFVTLGTDAVGDSTLGPASATLGADAVAASMATTLAGGVQLRWTVDQLPAGTNGMPTGISYGWTFCAGEGNCFAVTSQRVVAFPPQPNGGYDFWRCADSSCTPDAWAYVSTGAATYDGTTKTVTVSLTAGQIGATPGATIASVGVSDQGPVYIGAGESLVAVLVSPGIDGVPEVADFTVAKKEVSVAVGARGLDPASMAYGTPVTPAGTGAYSASVNVAGQSGDQAVYVRACFGANNCGYAAQDITL